MVVQHNSKTNNQSDHFACNIIIIMKFAANLPFFNSLPNDKILDWSKLKALADNKMNVVENLKFVDGRIENIVEKGENAGYQNFLLFQQGIVW